MAYSATKQEVSNRGSAPDPFLDELIAWGRTAPEEIFAQNAASADIYANVYSFLGPWKSPVYRRAVMLEVLRVLAGFESSWDWNDGSNLPASVPLDQQEAGAWQVSADSMGWGSELRSLVVAKAGSDDAQTFRQAMRSNHLLAMEYIARLLRRTIKANGPIVNDKFQPYLRRDAAAEFLALLSPSSARSVVGTGMIDDMLPQFSRRRL